LDVYPVHEEERAVRIHFFGDVIEAIQEFDPLTGKAKNALSRITIYPATHYVTTVDIRERAIRNIKPLAVPAVLGLNLFVRGALYMAVRKPLAPAVKSGLAAPYNCWPNRIATLKFVQDIPVNEQDTSYHLVKYVDAHLERLSGLPMLICWGERDFVFDTDYRDEWQRRFPKAEVHTFADAGHYVLEDVPEKIVPLVQDFLQRHPL